MLWLEKAMENFIAQQMSMEDYKEFYQIKHQQAILLSCQEETDNSQQQLEQI